MSRYRCNACGTIYPALQADGSELAHVCARVARCIHCGATQPLDGVPECKPPFTEHAFTELVPIEGARDERLDAEHVVTYAGKLTTLEIQQQRAVIRTAMETQGPSTDLKTQLADLEPVDPMTPHTIRAEGKGRTLLEE